MLVMWLLFMYLRDMAAGQKASRRENEIERALESEKTTDNANNQPAIDACPLSMRLGSPV